MTDPVPFFREVAAAHPRCFWLDGGGAREWSGRRSIIGWLDDEDVSLTYDATRSEVRASCVRQLRLVRRGRWRRVRGPGGRARRPGGRPTSGSATSATPPGPTSPPATGQRDPGRGVDAGPARADVRPPDLARVRVAQVAARREPTSARAAHPRLRAGVRDRSRSTCTPATPTRSTSPTGRSEVSDLDPATAYLRLRELNPAPYAGFLQHDLPAARAWLLSSSPERYALIDADRMHRDQADQGHHPPRRHAGGGRDACATGWPPSRSSAPRT